MSRRLGVIALVALVIHLDAEGTAATAQAPEGERGIQGVWVLNDELSDDPRAQFQGGEPGEERHPGRGGGSGRGGDEARLLRRVCDRESL